MMSLPILNSRFFEEHRPNLGFFSKWSSFYTWSEQLLPVYEWQGVLYVGCSRPPKTFPHFEDQKIVLVLCEPGVLQDLWLDFQAPPSSIEFSLEPAASSSHFSGLPTLPEPQEASEAMEDSSPDLQHMKTVVLKNAESDIPEGLSLDHDSSQVSDEFSLEALVSPEDSDPTLKLEDSPEPENLEEPKNDDEHSNELLDLTIGSDLQTNSQNSGLVALKPLDPQKDSGAESLAELMKDPSEAPAVAAESEPAEKRAKPVMTEILSTGEVTRIAHQALNSTPTGKLEPWLDQIFETMDKKFFKTMVLLKTGDQAKPWKWDAKFNPPQTSKSIITLVQPSPFRIVARTKKPYHGYIVPSEQAQKFFAEWNNSHTPEHLTIAPILVDDHVIGFLLAIGDKSCDTKENLQLAENVASEMAKQINSQSKSLRAA